MKTLFGRQVFVKHPCYGDIYIFNNDFIGNHVMSGIWEQDISQAMAYFYITGTDVLDIGCNLGFSTLGMSLFCNVTGTVHMFECHPFTMTLCNQNMMQNEKLTLNCIMLQSVIVIN